MWAMHLRKINKNSKSIIYPLIPVQDALPSEDTLVHTHSDWDHLDTAIHLMCTALGRGRKPEYPEKSQEDLRRKCRLHRDHSRARELNFFPHQCYKKNWCYSRTCAVCVCVCMMLEKFKSWFILCQCQIGYLQVTQVHVTERNTNRRCSAAEGTAIPGNTGPWTRLFTAGISSAGSRALTSCLHPPSTELLYKRPPDTAEPWKIIWLENVWWQENSYTIFLGETVYRRVWYQFYK